MKKYDAENLVFGKVTLLYIILFFFYVLHLGTNWLTMCNLCKMCNLCNQLIAKFELSHDKTCLCHMRTIKWKICMDDAA